MKKVCEQVLEDFPRYERLLLGRKGTRGAGIYVTDLKPSSNRWKVCRTRVEHGTERSEPIMLHTEVSCHEEKNFKFLLFAHDYMPVPLVNFDSQGATHRNARNVPFPAQAVTTPHFNRYDSGGHRYAYKTAPLQDPAALAQLAIVGNCIIHFYDEFNMHHDPAQYPSVYLSNPLLPELFANPVNDDPLADVTQF
ncbi:hypothetical protein [Hymenobacter convexus]|uniref:hypothetical protein n=1 Tax=Hymenobacter sp. CA1UV-4 TaxID=3063782 RepID=UPI0027133917|nr:hypothetical protein [Hymenobacter sp. CA1UV-4]MDO7852972.1 hypothetical protein [Hymenobacter sp. CA1UV-4]